MSNLYRKFRELMPDAPLLVGTVIATDPLRVELPDGSQITARGEGAIGLAVFVRDGVIEGPAPELPVEIIEL